MRGRGSGVGSGLLAGPAVENFFDGLQHRCGVEVADHHQKRVFRRVKLAIDLREIGTLVGGHLRFGRSDVRVRMRAKQNLAQALAGQKSGLRSIELYFFEFLAALALEFRLREGSFARQLIDEAEQRFGQFRQASESDRAGVRSSAGGKIGADAAQVFFDLTADAPRRSGADDRCGHFREAGSAIDHRGVAGAEREFAVKFRNGVRFRENDFQTVRQARFGSLRPGHRALRRQCRRFRGQLGGSSGHYAASFAPAFMGVRKTMARFVGRRYFLATA